MTPSSQPRFVSRWARWMSFYAGANPAIQMLPLIYVWAAIYHAARKHPAPEHTVTLP